MTTVPVVIVGAGPTGLTAATLLARHGIRSVVLERHADVYPLPRAVHLDDEVLRILQRIAIADRFRDISRPAPGMRLVDGRLRTMAEFRRDRPLGDHGWPQANLFDQPDLERLLRANLSDHPEVELRGSTLVESVAPVAGGPVQVRFRDESGRSSVLRAEAVLGCDGANSTVRDAVGARLRDLRFTERWLVVDIRSATPLSMWDGVTQVCDPHRAATFMRLRDNRYRWEFRLRDGETDLDVPVLLTPWTRGATPEVLRQTVYTFQARVADRWQRDRMFLLGDAAHLTPPFIGQGMGAGLRDAANLTWKLALVLSGRADERLLDTYEAERAPHVTRVIRNAVAVGWAMTGGQDRAAAVRRVLLAVLCQVPGVTAAALRTTSPRLPRGMVVRRRRVADPLPGTPCPQPLIDGRRLDDLLGGGFAVLAGCRVDPSLAAVARRLDARVVEIGPGHPLAGWLRRGRARAAVLRPDRVVLATVPLRDVAADPLDLTPALPEAPA